MVRIPARICHNISAVMISMWFVSMVLPADVLAQVSLTTLTDLQMDHLGAEYYKITVPGTGQVLSHISPTLHQGNAEIYSVDPRIRVPGDLRRMGIYWSQFLMIGTDPSPGPGEVAHFLTDWVESEGQQLSDFDVIAANGKYIEYEGTWTFRDLFTTTARHWIWVDGDNMYHRVRTNLEVLSPINNVHAIWTEFFNPPDPFATIAVQTEEAGVQTRNILGTSNSHHLGEYTVGRDGWFALLNPQKDQVGSIARVLLSSQSDIRVQDEVTPVWADYPLFDNIEFHIHRSNGTNLGAGTSFFMDNLLISDPTTDSTDWIAAKIERAKQWIDLIGPPLDSSSPVLGTGDRRSHPIPEPCGRTMFLLAGLVFIVFRRNTETRLLCDRMYHSKSRKSHFISYFVLAISWSLLSVPAALSQNNYFIPLTGVGLWKDSINWTSGQVPVAGETPYIHDARMVWIDQAYAYSLDNLFVANFDRATDDGTLTLLDGGGLRIANHLYLSSGPAEDIHGIINQTGGSLTVGGALFLAFEPSHSAEYNLTAGHLTVGNLWFRFGNATLNQTGGIVQANHLVLGEGGNSTSQSVYRLREGILRVAGTANIGKGLASGDSFANSDGMMEISGGIATFGDLLFGNDPNDQLSLSPSGLLRVRKTNYSQAQAMADIGTGNLIGAEGDVLLLNDVRVDSVDYTQVSASQFHADFNKDGFVNALDLDQWQGDYGLNTFSDADDDGDSDGHDFLVWQRQFGSVLVAPSASITPTPEPCTGLLLVIGLLVLESVKMQLRPSRKPHLQKYTSG